MKTWLVYHLQRETGWSTEMISKTGKWEIPFEIGSVPFVQFTLIYSASVERFTIGAGPGTGRKKVNGTQFSVRILWLGSLNYFSRCSVYFGNFPTGQTKIALPFTVQQKFLAVFWKW